MKTKIILVFIVSACIISCGKPGTKGLSLKKAPKQDTVVDSLAIRVIKEYFSNGKVKTETSAKGNLREGLTKNYDREGHLLSQVTYVNNVREGMATNFYPKTGKVNSTLVYKNGIKEGDEIWYYESGQAYRVTPYIKGYANGIQKFYYETGELLAEIPMKNGNPGIGLKEYNKDGSLITSYPKLIIKQKDYIATANKVILQIELSDPRAQVKFYRGRLEDGKYLTNKLLTLAMQNGISQVDFNVPPGSAVNQTVVITANVKTSKGNPLLLSRSFNVHAINNN